MRKQATNVSRVNCQLICSSNGLMMSAVSVGGQCVDPLRISNATPVQDVRVVSRVQGVKRVLIKHISCFDAFGTACYQQW